MRDARVLVALHETQGCWSYTLIYPNAMLTGMVEDAVKWFPSATDAVNAASGHLQRLVDSGLTTLAVAP